jgi:hypothetical protein
LIRQINNKNQSFIYMPFLTILLHGLSSKQSMRCLWQRHHVLWHTVVCHTRQRSKVKRTSIWGASSSKFKRRLHIHYSYRSMDTWFSRVRSAAKSGVFLDHNSWHRKTDPWRTTYWWAVELWTYEARSTHQIQIIVFTFTHAAMF